MLEGYDYVLERQLKPEARKDIIALFSELGDKANLHDRYFRRIVIRTDAYLPAIGKGMQDLCR